MPPGEHSDDNDDNDYDVDDDQEVCPLENDNSTLIMVLGGETARENRENEHSTSIGNNYDGLVTSATTTLRNRPASQNAVCVSQFSMLCHDYADDTTLQQHNLG